jgi:DNA mismatch endonuclease, patch repair protein
MPDVFSKKKRSEVMSRIRSHDTQPELTVRSLLHRKGYRFRLHVKGLPGRPDIVLSRQKTVLFVHGCFWHRHERCRFAYMPKSRVKFWTDKFDANVTRDRLAKRALSGLGWHTITIWECELRNLDKLSHRLDRLLAR